VRVDKAGPYWFILDTGSVSDAVDTETAKSLNIKLGHPFEASGGGEKSVTAAKGSNVAIDIGDLELRQSEVDVEPVSAAISAAEGRTVDGLLGYDFLSPSSWRSTTPIDGSRCTIRMASVTLGRAK
jgi:predicted aspartyl protease